MPTMTDSFGTCPVASRPTSSDSRQLRVPSHNRREKWRLNAPILRSSITAISSTAKVRFQNSPRCLGYQKWKSRRRLRSTSLSRAVGNTKFGPSSGDGTTRSCLPSLTHMQRATTESRRTASSKSFGDRIRWPYRQQDDVYSRPISDIQRRRLVSSFEDAAKAKGVRMLTPTARRTALATGHHSEYPIRPVRARVVEGLGCI